MAVRVVTDSVASLPADLVSEYGIEVASLYVNEPSGASLDTDLDPDDFYARLVNMPQIPTSAQPSLEAFTDIFERIVKAGDEALGVFISSDMSGTFGGAELAARMVLEATPGARIELVDSRSNSMQEGYAALAAATAAKAGAGIEQCRDAALETMRRTRYLFTPETLEYLRRGGRIGNASALLGGLLQIRPILEVVDGKTTTFAKVRTYHKAIAEIGRTFAEDVASHGLRRVVVHYIGERSAGETFAKECVEPVVGAPVRVLPVSPVIGMHVGPATAIVYELEEPIR